MALTKTVTKLWPVLGSDGRTFTVGIHLVLQDDGVTVVESDFSATYGGAGQLSVAQNNVLLAAQTAINKYKSEKAVNINASYTTAISQIDAALAL